MSWSKQQQCGESSASAAPEEGPESCLQIQERRQESDFKLTRSAFIQEVANFAAAKLAYFLDTNPHRIFPCGDWEEFEQHGHEFYLDEECPTALFAASKSVGEALGRYAPVIEMAVDSIGNALLLRPKSEAVFVRGPLPEEDDTLTVRIGECGGLPVRVVRDYDSVRDRWLVRFDCFFGVGKRLTTTGRKGRTNAGTLR